MAGFFGFFDYNKPGRGIDKDTPQKTGLALFFELISRKFGNYVKLNMLYAITSIPAFIVYFIMFMYLISILTNTQFDSESVGIQFAIAAVFSIFAIILFGGGPFAAGYNYILRNYYREEHSWIWSDFWGQTFKNIKQGLTIWFVDTIFVFLLLFSLKYYYINSKEQVIYLVLMILLIILSIIYIAMHFYIWTMTVTFHLTVKQIYKNALLLCMITLPRTILGIIIFAAYFFILFSVVPITFFLAPFILLAPIGLVSHMISYPVIKKYMMDKLNQDSTEQEQIED